ncbi:MAG: arsenate reductase (glutaredoxin) [Chlorobi bacterium]|nr:arsenate reductase (glutaredoxin) [Chlorobiota bacterium]
MLTIYHNTRCKKSRAGLEYIQKKGLDYKIVEYLKFPLTKDELKNIIQKLNVKPFNLIRTQEAIYKSDFKGKEFTDDEWVDILIQHPKLLQRPIVVNNNKAVLGQPAEEIEKIL